MITRITKEIKPDNAIGKCEGVMVSWKDPSIMLPDTAFEKQERFFAWIKDNVDFGVRSRRVD